MLNIFILLSIYEVSQYISGEHFFTSFPTLEYGFNKNADILLNISKLNSSLIFGFATKEEINHISSLPDLTYYCSNSIELSEHCLKIDFDQIFYFEISKKNILTPYIYSCSNVNQFNLTLEITNGKNNLDYRCQNAMIYSLVFSILYFIIGISFFIYCLILRRTEWFKFIFIIFIIIFFGLEEILFYAYFIRNKDKEYFDVSNSQFYLNTAFIFFKFASILVLSLYNSSLYDSFMKSTKIRTYSLIYWAISSAFLIIVLVFVIININNNESRLISFFVPSVFYLLFVVSQSILLNPFSIYKIANLFFTFGNYFTFSMNSFYTQEMKEQINPYLMILGLNIASIIIQVITLFLLLFGFIYDGFKSSNKNDDDLSGKAELSDQSFSSDISK